MSETHPPRRIGQSIVAVIAGMLVGIVITLGTDVVLHAVGVFPPWGASMVGFDGPLSCLQRRIALFTVFWAATSLRGLRPTGPCSTPWWAASSALW
jgi:hypothetical protein